ncbi:PilZ domain-containing protein [Acidobacteriota bacterium]
MGNKKDVRAWKDRRDKRFEEENKVIIEWSEHKNPEKDNKIYAFTQDISVGGAKILTDINFPIETTFVLTLSLSRSNQIVRVASNVRWVNPVYGGDLYEVGLEFIHSYPKTISCLLRHLFGRDFPKDVALELTEAQR